MRCPAWFKTVAMATCLLTTGCGRKGVEPCLRKDSVGMVVVVTETAGRPDDESHQVSIRKSDGVTTTCLGGADAAKLMPGQTIDARNLKPYPTRPGETYR